MNTVLNAKTLKTLIKQISPLRDNDFIFEDLFQKPKDLSTHRNKIGKFYNIMLDEPLELLGNKFRNAILYPPFGGMGWHTNGPNTGKRIYISWSETGDSGMNWYDVEKDTIIVDKDEVGFNIRIFDIPQWHCVWAKCNRFSIGFDIG